jgi:hypothetical protein
MKGVFTSVREIIFGFFRAYGYIAGNKLVWPLVLSGVVNLAVVAAIVVGGMTTAVHVVSPWLESLLADTVNETWLWVLNSIAGALLVIGFVIIGLLIYRPLAMVLMMPFLAYLASRVFEIELNTRFPFNIGVIITDLLKAVYISLINTAAEFSLMILVFAAGFLPLPGVRLLLFPLPIIIGGYFLSKSYFDLILEIFRYPVTERGRVPGEHRLFNIVNGTLLITLLTVSSLIFILLSFLAGIPVVGWLLAGIAGLFLGSLSVFILFTAPACSTVNSSLYYLRHIHEQYRDTVPFIRQVEGTSEKGE